MTRSILFSALAFVLLAGCAAAPTDDVGESSGEALTAVASKPAVKAKGAAPEVETVWMSDDDWRRSGIDRSSVIDAQGRLDLSKLKISVLDSGSADHADYMTHAKDLQWVETDDKPELPPFVRAFTDGVEVGPFHCRIESVDLGGKTLIKGGTAGCSMKFR